MNDRLLPQHVLRSLLALKTNVAKTNLKDLAAHKLLGEHPDGFTPCSYVSTYYMFAMAVNVTVNLSLHLGWQLLFPMNKILRILTATCWKYINSSKKSYQCVHSVRTWIWIKRLKQEIPSHCCHHVSASEKRRKTGKKQHTCIWQRRNIAKNNINLLGNHQLASSKSHASHVKTS